jgi:acyl-CoA thioester hydrolase
MKEPDYDPISRVRYRVIYGDTDQMGVVYYANYLRWFEKGRTEFLRRARLPYKAIEEMGYRFPVAEVSCRYYRPARYDEIIVIETRLVSLRRAALGFRYSLSNEAGAGLVAEGSTRHACVDSTGRIARIPLDLKAQLQSSLSPGTDRRPSHPEPIS